MEISKLKTDPQLELDGVRVDCGEGLFLTVARLGNHRYNDCMDQLLKPHRKQIRRGTLSREKQEEVLCRAISKTVLLNWEGLTENDHEIPYSQEKAFELLMTIRDFRELVVELATESATFHIEMLGEATENFENASSGK